jgi:hypothetical protein
MMRATLSEEVSVYLSMMTPEEVGPLPGGEPQAVPARLRAALRAAASRAAHSPRPDELWRVEPGALLWVDYVQGGALYGYLVHDAPRLAGPDELIVRGWERADEGEEDVVVCLWRRLRVPVEQAQARAGSLSPRLREAAVRAHRGEGGRVEADEDGVESWEVKGTRGLVRWETGADWTTDDPRQRVRTAWSARTEMILEPRRSMAALVLEAARALVAVVERAASETFSALPPLVLNNGAVRHAATNMSGAALVELEVEVGQARVTLCLEEHADMLLLSAYAHQDGHPLAGVILVLTSPDLPRLTQTTDADGLCELSAALTHERATVEVWVGDAVSVVEL